MGEIVGAAVVSHVPPLVLPEQVRRELNGGEDTSLFQGLHDMRAEKLGPVEADTVVVIDSHSICCRSCKATRNGSRPAPSKRARRTTFCSSAHCWLRRLRALIAVS